jgi:hypothetical protein
MQLWWSLPHDLHFKDRFLLVLPELVHDEGLEGTVRERVPQTACSSERGLESHDRRDKGELHTLPAVWSKHLSRRRVVMLRRDICLGGRQLQVPGVRKDGLGGRE